jgi:hypothetical protein
MPDPITWGHLLMLAGLLAALYGLWQLVVWARHGGRERGTPEYARSRDARRFAIAGLAAGALLFAAGCFTPLCYAAIA